SPTPRPSPSTAGRSSRRRAGRRAPAVSPRCSRASCAPGGGSPSFPEEHRRGVGHADQEHPGLRAGRGPSSRRRAGLRAGGAARCAAGRAGPGLPGGLSALRSPPRGHRGPQRRHRHHGGAAAQRRRRPLRGLRRRPRGSRSRAPCRRELRPRAPGAADAPRLPLPARDRTARRERVVAGLPVGHPAPHRRDAAASCFALDGFPAKGTFVASRSDGASGGGRSHGFRWKSPRRMATRRAMEEKRLGFWARLAMFFWLPWKILFGPRAAWRVREALRAPEVPEPAALPAPPKPPKPEPKKPSGEEALRLLAILQRDGRLVDFLMEDISAAPDDQVGAAARIVHEGCRKALAQYVTLRPLRPEREGET